MYTHGKWTENVSETVQSCSCQNSRWENQRATQRCLCSHFSTSFHFGAIPLSVEYPSSHWHREWPNRQTDRSGFLQSSCTVISPVCPWELGLSPGHGLRSPPAHKTHWAHQGVHPCEQEKAPQSQLSDHSWICRVKVIKTTTLTANF